MTSSAPIPVAGDPVPCTTAPDVDALGVADLVSHPRPFACELKVDLSHHSRAVAHVSNVEYVAWLDRVAELHGDAVGCERAKLLARGIMWFVARHEVDYRAEAASGDELIALTWVRDMHRTRSWRDTIIVRPSDHTVVCRAATLWVLVNLESRRPTRIDPALAASFDPLHPLRPRPAPRT